MVAIDMEMPSCCANCVLCINGQYEELTCALLVEEWEETDYNSDHRDEKCPLVEIGTCKDCKQLGVMDCGYYCKLNHWGKISTESYCGGMGDFYCADFEKRGYKE